MFRVMMVIDDNTYEYGKWNDRDKANEIAMEVREDRGIETYIEEI